jgi:hypothetical protein
VEIVLVKQTKHNFVKRLGAVSAFSIVQQPYFTKNFTCLNQIKGRFLAIGRAFRNFDAPVFQKKHGFRQILLEVNHVIFQIPVKNTAAV